MIKRISAGRARLGQLLQYRLLCGHEIAEVTECGVHRESNRFRMVATCVKHDCNCQIMTWKRSDEFTPYVAVGASG